MRQRRHNRTAGFSLIEVVVGIALLGLVSAPICASLVLSVRLNTHARMLMEGGMRATEACYRCGFRSYSSFTRSYGKYFGTTPTGRLGQTDQGEAGYE